MEKELIVPEGCTPGVIIEMGTYSDRHGIWFTKNGFAGYAVAKEQDKKLMRAAPDLYSACHKAHAWYCKRPKLAIANLLDIIDWVAEGMVVFSNVLDAMAKAEEKP